MNITSLQTFLTIVRTGSLVRASAQLNVTQSTVTARLQALEAELGQTLVVRQKNGASLTAAGIKLRRYAEAMTQLWSQARQEVALPSGVSRICNMGCEVSLWPDHGRKIFDHIHTTMPSAALSAWHGDDQDMTEWLANGLVDVAVTHTVPPRQANGRIHNLPDDQLILVADKPNTPMRHDPGYIYVEAGPAFERQHTQSYSDADTAKLSFSNPEWALSHLLKHGGSAYLPHRMVENLLTAKCLFWLQDAPIFTRQSYLVITDNAAPFADVIDNLLQQWN